MKKGDVYRHFKGNIYKFIGIATPSEEISVRTYPYGSATAKHSETKEKVRVQQIPSFDNVYVSDLDEPVVLYKDTMDGQLWVRPVDMFFDYKVIAVDSVTRPDPVIKHVKRFTKIS